MKVEAIEKVVRRLGWRLRAQAALRYGLVLAAIGLFAFALAVVLVKARVLPADAVFVGGAVAIALPVLGVALGLARRRPDITLAATLDSASGLQSRLGSALAFARLGERTPMQDAAIDDALTVLSQARPALAAPWHWAAFASGAVALAVAAGLAGPAVFALELPVGAEAGQVLARVVKPPPFQRTRVTVRPDDAEALDELAQDLEAEVKTAADPGTKQFLEDLNELIRAMQEGRITPEEAAAKMAALEQALDAWKAEHQDQAEAVEKRLQEAAEKMKAAHEALEPALEAMKEREWEKAAQALEQLAKKLEDKSLKEADRKKLAKDLAELGKQLESERQKEKERLEKERDRLKEKQQKEKDRFADKDRDRLKETERRLEQLEDPAQDKDLSEPERQLERLSDELDEAAQDMLRRLAEELQKLGADGGESGPEDEQRREQAGQEGQQGQEGQDPEQGQEGQQGQQGKGGQQGDMTAEDLKRAAEALRKMAQGQKGRQQMRTANGRMIDVREMLKRGMSGGGKDGNGGQAGEEAGRGGKPGQSGKDGPSGEGGESAEQRFDRLAKGGMSGKDGEPMLLGGEKGQGGGLKIPGRGDGQGEPKLGQGEGIGKDHDPRLFGERTDIDAKTHDEFVPGVHGADGEVQSRIIMTAAKKGFASGGYGEIHQDYSEVVEDALEKEHIPAGKRTYVRRYFDLIRPR